MLLGVVLALATSVSWALGNVFVRKSGQAVGAARAMLWALLAGGCLSAALSLVFDDRAGPLRASVIGWTAVAGAAGLVGYACLFYSFEHSPLSIAVPLVSSWSLVAGVFALLVLGERPTPSQIAGALIVVTGVVLVSIGGSRAEAAPVHARRAGAVWAAFGAAAGFGIMVPAMTARVAPAVGAFGATALVYAVGLLLALPVALALGIPVRPPARRFWPLMLVTGCFETFGFVAVAFASRFAPTAVVAPVSSLAAALTVLYAWGVLRERPDSRAAAGAVLASIGIVVLSR